MLPIHALYLMIASTRFLSLFLPYIVYFVPAKKIWAMIPAIGGKMKVQARRISVNFHPRIPTSIGRRLTAHRDQPVRNAAIVPDTFLSGF